MKKFKIGAALLIFMLFLGVSAHAQMVSFFVIETGLPDNGNITVHSELWENAFLDVFFDAGHIVTNDPIMRIEKRPAFEAVQLINMNEVRQTGNDYIVIAQLDFESEITPPQDISLFIYRVNPQEKIFERKLRGSPVRDDDAAVRSIVRGLVPYLGR